MLLKCVLRDAHACKIESTHMCVTLSLSNTVCMYGDVMMLLFIVNPAAV